jgi:hypothetical protein
MNFPFSSLYLTKFFEIVFVIPDTYWSNDGKKMSDLKALKPFPR